MTDQPPSSDDHALPPLFIPLLPPMEGVSDVPPAPFPIVAETVLSPQALKTPPQPTTHDVSQRLLFSAGASSISTLTGSLRPHQSPTTSPEAPNKRTQPDDHEFHYSPSPKKPAPNFTTTPSDNNSVFSSDDVKGWEKEED